MLDTPHLETKSQEAAAVEGVMRAFEEFKATNDDRLSQIDAKLSADVVTTDKLARIERALDDLQLKAARPPIGGSAPRSSIDLAHKSAFSAYVRKGDDTALRSLETKALSVGSDPDGGYLVHPELEALINQTLRNLSPIRAISGVRQISAPSYKRPYSIAGLATGWVTETAVPPQTATPTLAANVYPTMELYAMPAATPNLLEDAVVNIDQWLAEEVNLAFAQQEGTAFVNGDGVTMPKGFLTYPTVDDSTWSWGNLGTKGTGVSGGFNATTPSDILIDLIYTLRAGYRPNATFVMSRGTEAVIRKFKDNVGEYLWHPSYQPGQPPTILGYPVAECEDMPAIAAGSLSVAFGDFSRGYLIVDRTGIRVLRDPYSAKPYVLFYTTKRVGGGVADFDAIKLLKFA